MSDWTKTYILVADDYEPMRTLIRAQLAKGGFVNIDLAVDGVSALSMLKTKFYDLLITDWNMPGLEGIELLKLIRTDERLKSLPVLMVTSNAAEKEVRTALASGVSDFIVKPFDNALFIKKVKMIIS